MLIHPRLSFNPGPTAAQAVKQAELKVNNCDGGMPDAFAVVIHRREVQWRFETPAESTTRSAM